MSCQEEFLKSWVVETAIWVMVAGRLSIVMSPELVAIILVFDISGLIGGVKGVPQPVVDLVAVMGLVSVPSAFRYLRV